MEKLNLKKEGGGGWRGVKLLYIFVMWFVTIFVESEWMRVKARTGNNKTVRLNRYPWNIKLVQNKTCPKNLSKIKLVQKTCQNTAQVCSPPQVIATHVWAEHTCITLISASAVPHRGDFEIRCASELNTVFFWVFFLFFLFLSSLLSSSASSSWSTWL